MESIQIAAIKLGQDFERYQNTESQTLQEISSLSRVNLMVGANNSGKSRFMRLLAMQEDYEVRLHNPDLDDIKEEVKKIGLRIKNEAKDLVYSINGVNFTEILNPPFPSYLSLSNDKLSQLRKNYKKENEIRPTSKFTPVYHGVYFMDEIKLIFSEIVDILNQVPTMSSESKPDQVYIPVLRGLRFVGNTKDDLYTQRTRQDYFIKQDISTPQIFTGLTLYERLTDMLLGEYWQRKRIQEYQAFISNILFEGKRITLIPNRKEGVIVVKIGREKERPIHHLGDGIQTAIILSFLPFISQRPTFFFIEEPEIHLHPGLQRKLLDFFISPECKNHHFFLSTHSNHFLDMTADYGNISVFTFRKKLANTDQGDEDEQTPTFVVEAVNSGDYSSLELLGVRNSSVFLVNATIWVEGITDRWYLRAMLNCYIEHLKESQNTVRIEEDTHYSFVEYGGSNITHWSFLDNEDHPIEVDRLCSRAIVIVDKDGDKKQERKDKLREKLHDRCIILAGREIENTLPPKVIAGVVKDYEMKKNPELKLPSFEYSDYQDEYLGTYIENTLLDGKPSRQGGYAKSTKPDKPATLKDKLGFCKKAIKKMKLISYSELPKPTKELIKKIYEFIVKQNS